MFLFISDTFWKIAIIHIRHLKMSIEYSLNKGIFPVFKQLIFLTRWQYLLKKGMFIGYFKMSIFFWTLFWWIVTVTYSEKNQIIISFKCHNKKIPILASKGLKKRKEVKFVCMSSEIKISTQKSRKTKYDFFIWKVLSFNCKMFHFV